MQEPVRVAFRNMEAPIGMEDDIRQRVDQLEQFCDRIITCSVVVEARHRRHRQGKLYHVGIDLGVPDRDIIVRRDPAENHAHEDLRVTLRDAFDAARRQLQDYARATRGDIKSHAEPPVGHIVRLLPDYGFLKTSTGEELYMHRNAVLGRGFDKLTLGDKVRYAVHEGEGVQGPQASTVIPL